MLFIFQTQIHCLSIEKMCARLTERQQQPYLMISNKITRHPISKRKKGNFLLPFFRLTNSISHKKSATLQHYQDSHTHTHLYCMLNRNEVISCSRFFACIRMIARMQKPSHTDQTLKSYIASRNAQTRNRTKPLHNWQLMRVKGKEKGIACAAGSEDIFSHCCVGPFIKCARSFSFTLSLYHCFRHNSFLSP